MTTGLYTVGTGGDFTDWKHVWTSLCAIGSLTKDYEFKQISDVTISGWPDITIAANRFNLNGHTVKFYCPWENSHQGDPTRGYKTYLTGATGYLALRNTSTYAGFLTDKFYLENLYLKQLSANDITLIQFTQYNAGLGEAIKAYAKNILIIGYGTNYSTAFACESHDTLYNLSNIKISNCKKAFDLGPLTSGGTPASDSRSVKNILENTSIYNIGAQYGVEVGTASLIRKWRLKNVVAAVTGGAAYYPSTASAGTEVYNCADDDNSISTMANATKVSCVANITPANEFESLVSTSSDFLRLKKGSLLSSPTVVPERGKSPLRVAFRNNTNYSYPSTLTLNDLGIAPTNVTQDIAGLNYGQFDDYPIGCHNVEIES